jgi:hypothetical protein
VRRSTSAEKVLTMPSLKVSEVVRSIAKLGTQTTYTYPTGNARVRILEARTPEGSIESIYEAINSALESLKLL